MSVTGRTNNAQTASDRTGTFRRVILPVFLFGAMVGAAGWLQQPSVNSLAVTGGLPTPNLGQVMVLDGLGQDDPTLSMQALTGQLADRSTVVGVHVLPQGNVPTTPVRFETSSAVATTTTRWLKNKTAATLWSGPDASATAFTDLPAGSFVRAMGPADGSRLPVYFVGDGLLRRAGNGWIDSTEFDTVEAPAPGQVPAIDADASQPLPVWVQAHRSTTLWSGADDRAMILTDVPQWTFLKVAGLERGGRILVNFAGDYASRQPGIGWVDSASVGPAGNPGRWVTNHRATTLWSGVDDRAMRFTDLPQWTKLRIVEGASADGQRMQVEYFGDGLTRAPGTAWITRADIGPITPPVPLPAAPKTTVRQIETHTFASGAEFIATVGEAAQRSRNTTGVPASVTVAQAILESDWGRSRLTRQGNNLFGIKALGSATGPAGVVTLATWEHVDGSDVIVQAPFKAYYTLEQSIDDHGLFFRRNRRYAAALAQSADAGAFAQQIHEAGYATDPSYAAKLIRLMDRYNLYRFDS